MRLQQLKRQVENWFRIPCNSREINRRVFWTICLVSLPVICFSIFMLGTCFSRKIYGNTNYYLKNHWTKCGHVCTYFNAFSMLIPNMDIIFYNFVICFGKNWITCRMYSNSRGERVLYWRCIARTNYSFGCCWGFIYFRRHMIL